MQMKQPDHITNLLEWAELGRAYAPRRSSRADWSAVEALIEAAQPRLLEDSKVLRELLERSREQLGLSDPLLCDLGVHRWLEADREESYSDWLAWVLEQLDEAEAVLAVLGVKSPQFVSACVGKSYHVEREAVVKEGYSGSRGRLDLLIHFGEPELAVVGVEVKTDDESYEKQQGYVQSLRGLYPRVECVLVTKDNVPEDQLFGFRSQTWEDLSVRLRRAIAGVVRGYGMDAGAAMMVSFVGAVERNLLGYGVAAPQRAWANMPMLLPAGLSNYLRKAIEVQL
jgi:hypothetical protein